MITAATRRLDLPAVLGQLRRLLTSKGKAMKILAFSIALLLSSAATAQQQDSAPEVTHVEGAAESTVNTRVICRQIGETGSRLTRNRVCMTESEWVEHRRTQRRIVSDSQRGAGPSEMTASQGAAALRACNRC